jgi:hypothetical protein
VRTRPLGGPVRRWGAGVAALVAAAALLTACSAARTGQGTSSESCYLALPTASEAVGDHGHLAGVRKYTLSGLHGVAPRLYGHLAHDVPKGQSVCIVAYTGAFNAAMVSKPLGRQKGTLAVVVVTTPANKLLGTLILTKIPVRFQHLF